MFQGSEGPSDVQQQVEYKRYPKGIRVIFNAKAYANRYNLKQWVHQEYKWGSVYSLLDNEPRLLTLNAFLVYKKSSKELKVQEDFVLELKKLNYTISIVLAGGIGYV
jgi:hypothetical protein